VPSPPDTNYVAAAQRHLADADFLHSYQRLASADHLAGLAAECALKAILVGYLGGTVNPGGAPTHPDTAVRYGHLPKLWTQLSALIEGQASAQFAESLLGSNPFQFWQIDERYCAGDHIDTTRGGPSSARREAADRHV